MDLVDLKKKFGISELKTEYAYSKHLKRELHRCGNNFADYALDVLNYSFDYSEWLNTTKVTPKLVEKLFKDMKQVYEWDRVGFSNGNVTFLFSTKVLVKVKKIGFNRVESFADLARLTKDSPIPLQSP